MSASPRILVIIVTWNKRSYVVDLLRSLQRLAYPVEQLDVLVVDNASNDGTVETLEKDFPDVQVIVNSENLGGTGGFNTGLQYAFEQPEGRHDYLWLLDNDVQVHRNTLTELVTLLETEKDAAIAGSTMMQLTSPCRINEMGAFVELDRGTLILNRHREDVSSLQGKSLKELQEDEIDLSEHLQDCKASMDVDYVAAASLVIRTRVARTAGLWDDYFIHFDDVEWCLRIAQMGHRILVSARSLIWHLPAENKVPTWILYYDNRNVLYMLEKHAGPGSVRGTRRWIRKKSLYYTLLGKNDLARLHLEALDHFTRRKTGKHNIVLDDCYHDSSEVEELLKKEKVQRILLPWTIDLKACGLQKTLEDVMGSCPDLQVDYLSPPSSLQDALPCQLRAAKLINTPAGKLKRMWTYLKLRNRYDLVMQSDYQPILPVSLAGKNILFVNYEQVSLRERPTLKRIMSFVMTGLLPFQ